MRLIVLFTYLFILVTSCFYFFYTEKTFEVDSFSCESILNF